MRLLRFLVYGLLFWGVLRLLLRRSRPGVTARTAAERRAIEDAEYEVLEDEDTKSS